MDDMTTEELASWHEFMAGMSRPNSDAARTHVATAARLRATDAELERLRELLSDIKEWEIGRESREPLFVLPTELRARIQAAIDEARKG